MECCCGIIGRANGYGMYDCFRTKIKCCVKAHRKSKFIPNTSLFFVPGANESAFCCHFVYSLKNVRKHIQMTSQQWIESMEQMTPNVSVLVLTEPQLVSHPSNPNFYRLNSDCTDWKTMMSSIIKFLKEEKFILTNSMWRILSLSQKIEGKLMSFQKYWYYTSCFLSQVFNASPGFCNCMFLWWPVIQNLCIQRSLQCHYY